jgi:integrase
MSKATIWRRYKASLKAARIDDHPFHDLRHTFGTRMAASGVAPRTLQEWMGHASIKTTEIYSHYAPNPHEVDLVNKAFANNDPVSAPLPSGA